MFAKLPSASKTWVNSKPPPTPVRSVQGGHIANSDEKLVGLLARVRGQATDLCRRNGAKQSDACSHPSLSPKLRPNISVVAPLRLPQVFKEFKQPFPSTISAQMSTPDERKTSEEYVEDVIQSIPRPKISNRTTSQQLVEEAIFTTPTAAHEDQEENKWNQTENISKPSSSLPTPRYDGVVAFLGAPQPIDEKLKPADDSRFNTPILNCVETEHNPFNLGGETFTDNSTGTPITEWNPKGSAEKAKSKLDAESETAQLAGSVSRRKESTEIVKEALSAPSGDALNSIGQHGVLTDHKITSESVPSHQLRKKLDLKNELDLTSAPKIMKNKIAASKRPIPAADEEAISTGNLEEAAQVKQKSVGITLQD